MQELRRLLRYFFQLLSHCQGGHKAFRLSRFHLKGHFFVIFRIKLSFNHSAAVDVSVRKSDHCLTAQHLEETVIVFQQKSVITPEIMQIFRAVRQKISTSYSCSCKDAQRGGRAEREKQGITLCTPVFSDHLWSKWPVTTLAASVWAYLTVSAVNRL